jgi:hypothetical protein
MKELFCIQTRPEFPCFPLSFLSNTHQNEIGPSVKLTGIKSVELYLPFPYTLSCHAILNLHMNDGMIQLFYVDNIKMNLVEEAESGFLSRYTD